jgi:hypothetical protein
MMIPTKLDMLNDTSISQRAPNTPSSEGGLTVKMENRTANSPDSKKKHNKDQRQRRKGHQEEAPEGFLLHLLDTPVNERDARREDQCARELLVNVLDGSPHVTVSNPRGYRHHLPKSLPIDLRVAFSFLEAGNRFQRYGDARAVDQPHALDPINFEVIRIGEGDSHTDQLLHPVNPALSRAANHGLQLPSHFRGIEPGLRCLERVHAGDERRTGDIQAVTDIDNAGSFLNQGCLYTHLRLQDIQIVAEDPDSHGRRILGQIPDRVGEKREEGRFSMSATPERARMATVNRKAFA